jgi:hypothetical protein
VRCSRLTGAAPKLKRKAPPRWRGFRFIIQNALAVLTLLAALTGTILLLLLAGLLTAALLAAAALLPRIALLLLARLLIRILVGSLVLRHCYISPTLLAEWLEGYFVTLRPIK